MSTAAVSTICLFTRDPSASSVGPVLTAAGFEVSAHPLTEPAAAHGRPAHLIVVETAAADPLAPRLCQTLRLLQAEQFVPILVVGDDADARLAGLEGGADSCLVRPHDARALLAQVRALVRIKQRHDQLAARAAEATRISKRLQAARQQIDQEMEIARRLQESFLPRSLPTLPGLRFTVSYRPCGKVGGDFYDVFRLDEQHLGFYVADAVGHGVPASLLTVFIKQVVRPKEIDGQSYRLVPPGEVLQNLNCALIAQALSDVPFITMVYALYNHADGTLQFARAGHPHPLYLPYDGPAQLWQIEGSMLGVFETTYRVQTQRLRPGDRLLLYTDGMDAAAFQQEPVGLPSLLAAVNALRDRPIDEMVDHLAGGLFHQTERGDDLTLLGVEVS